MAEAFVAFGGNIGDVRTTITRAIEMLCDGRDVRLLARSSDYRTPPWGVTDQPPFVNAAILIATTLTPQVLLARAHEIERVLGRVRNGEQRYGPRPIDIDLLTYDGCKLATEALTLPHPRLFERAFVLVPLAEIAPERVVEGLTLRDWAARTDATGIERIE
jgi:2-amino-4-hydroxy-6-hydroxymethyldihydropteridine diphosphokinase